VKERELENQYNLRKLGAEDQVEKLKKAAADQVEIRRSKLKEKVRLMRKRAAKREKDIYGQIQAVRATLAGNLQKAYKKGDPQECVKANQDDTNRVAWCSANFFSDYRGFMDCKSEEDFCHFCCDNLFGDLFAQEKLKCYNIVCGMLNKGIDGQWVWEKAVSKEGEKPSTNGSEGSATSTKSIN